MVKSGVGSRLVGEKFMPIYIFFFLGPDETSLFSCAEPITIEFDTSWSDRRVVSSQTSNLTCRSKCIEQFNVKYLS